jgi:hypothetical protein
MPTDLQTDPNSKQLQRRTTANTPRRSPEQKPTEGCTGQTGQEHRSDRCSLGSSGWTAPGGQLPPLWFAVSVLHFAKKKNATVHFFSQHDADTNFYTPLSLTVVQQLAELHDMLRDLELGTGLHDQWHYAWGRPSSQLGGHMPKSKAQLMWARSLLGYGNLVAGADIGSLSRCCLGIV